MNLEPDYCNYGSCTNLVCKKQDGSGWAKTCEEHKQAGRDQKRRSRANLKVEKIKKTSNGQLTGREPAGFQRWYTGIGREECLWENYEFAPTADGVALALSTCHASDMTEICQGMLKTLLQTREKNERARLEALVKLGCAHSEYKKKVTEEKLACIEPDYRVANEKLYWIWQEEHERRREERERIEEEAELKREWDYQVNGAMKREAAQMDSKARIRYVLDMWDHEEAWVKFGLLPEEQQEYHRHLQTADEQKRQAEKQAKIEARQRRDEEDKRRWEEEMAKLEAEEREERKKRRREEEDEEVERKKRQKKECEEATARYFKKLKRERRVSDLMFLGSHKDPEIAQYADIAEKYDRLKKAINSLENPLEKHNPDLAAYLAAKKRKEREELLRRGAKLPPELTPAEVEKQRAEDLQRWRDQLAPLHEQLFPEDDVLETTMDKLQDLGIEKRKAWEEQQAQKQKEQDEFHKLLHG